jgi:predicted DNA-binding transcriptional regulator AlpA
MNELARQQEYVRTREAARYLSLSPRTLEKLRVMGSGPDYFKMGRAVLYAIGELDAWLARNRRCSTSDTGGLSVAPPRQGIKL